MSLRFRVVLKTTDDASLIGRFMLIFTRRRIEVSDFAYRRLSEGHGLMTIDFLADNWVADNVCKQLRKQIDIHEAEIKELVKPTTQ